MVAETLESVPKGPTHRGTRVMASEMELTQHALLRIWHAFGLQPHRQENIG